MIIDLRNISKHYEMPGTDKRQVLDQISLSINEGDALAVVGPSGSGKSTLLNIMGTLDKPSSGSVLFKRQDVLSLNDKELAVIRNKSIGFVFQKHYLLPQLSLLDNVLLPVIPQKNKVNKKDTIERVMCLLKLVGLSDKIKHLPGQLSVGECQRTAVVRALVNKPEIILADEPTGSLDHDSSAQLGELLLSLVKDFSVAIVIITHSQELAKKMTTSYRLLNGKLLAI
jgi:ABC-type lipoprotein export system ATPase subunit